MQWWRAAQGIAWDWGWRPFPGVWLFIAALTLGYARLFRAGQEGAGAAGNHASRWRLAPAIAGILLLWSALDWPVGPLGAGYLASVHAGQYILIALLAPPLLLVGLPRERYEALTRRESVLRWMRAEPADAPRTEPVRAGVR